MEAWRDAKIMTADIALDAQVAWAHPLAAQTRSLRSRSRPRPRLRHDDAVQLDWVGTGPDASQRGSAQELRAGTL